jgi:4-diphosphocytidyl-2-C-methyl-D-erythritol kinase
MRVTGIGEGLDPTPTLPPCALVLVNPRVAVPTAQVFRALPRVDNPALPPLPQGLGFDAFCDWLAAQRNDLQAPAETLAPAISQVLQRLRLMPAVRFACMSGSGATCVGVVRDMASARQVARAIQVSEMAWWVAPAQMLQDTLATT